MTLGNGADASIIIDIIFWVIAASSIVAAIAVIQLKDLFRAAMFLAVSFLGVAGLFVLLRAEFLAIVQVLIYVGAISVLIIFAVLTTKDVEHGNPSNRLRVPAVVLAVLFLAVTAFVVLKTEWRLIDDVVPSTAAGATATGEGVLSAETVEEVERLFENTIPRIAALLLRDYVLAFEAASVLLLAAIVGALALVRDPEAT
jgi:NADH-quinone oxidoreductase subunit J